METVKDNGWGWPLNSRKAHFFADGRSLCGRWLFFGTHLEPFEKQEKPGPDDCTACFKKALGAQEKA